MSANNRTNDPADHVSGAADPAGCPFWKPIEATVGSVPYGEAATSRTSQSCSGIRPTPEAKLLMDSSSATAEAVSPLCNPFSPRSAERAGQRWPVPCPLGAHGCPSDDPSP